MNLLEQNELAVFLQDAVATRGSHYISVEPQTRDCQIHILLSAMCKQN